MAAVTLTYRLADSWAVGPQPNGPFTDRWQISSNYQVGQLTVVDGKLQVAVTVSGTRWNPVLFGDDSFHPFGPEEWIFYVTDSLGIDVVLELATDGHGAPYGVVATNDPSNLVIHDVSGPDAMKLDKDAHTGRATQLANEISDLLS